MPGPELPLMDPSPSTAPPAAFSPAKRAFRRSVSVVKVSNRLLDTHGKIQFLAQVPMFGRLEHCLNTPEAPAGRSGSERSEGGKKMRGPWGPRSESDLGGESGPLHSNSWLAFRKCGQMSCVCEKRLRSYRSPA